MKKVIKGWIGKSYDPESLIGVEGSAICGPNYDIKYPFYTTRGKKSVWDTEDWPPTKVTITVETEE